MKPPFNPFFKKIMTTMALFGALLCSFAANAIGVTHEGMKLKGATLAEPKPNTSLPSEKPIAPSAAKGTVGFGDGGKGGAGSVGNSKAPKGSAADGSDVTINSATGEFTYTPTVTAPKSASQGRPAGDTANDLKAPALPK